MGTQPMAAALAKGNQAATDAITMFFGELGGGEVGSLELVGDFWEIRYLGGSSRTGKGPPPSVSLVLMAAGRCSDLELV